MQHAISVCLCGLLFGASLSALAQEAAPAPPPAPPERVTVRLTELNYLTGISDPGATSLDPVQVRVQQLAPRFGTSRLLSGCGLFDLEVRTNGVKFHWLPVSLYYVPVIVTGRYAVTTPAAGATPAATTTVSYPRYVLYGVISANANHLFDFGAQPLETEHGRAGAGILWARREPDRQAAAATKPGTSYAVRLQGLELARGTTGGEEIWYLSYVRGHAE